MYARSTTVQGSPDRVDLAIAMVRDEVLPAVAQMPGCLGLSLMIDREDGHGIVTTSWESEEAMRATAEAVAPMREKAANLMGGTAEVQEWEIAVMHRAHPAPAGSCVRSTWLKADPAGIERSLDVFRLAVLPRVEELQGFCSASLMIDRDSGLAVSSIAFDSRSAIEASRDAAQAIRAGAVKEIGAEVLDVREHDLLLAHLHVPEMA
jgi:quinol monooxygenase YgiN